MQPRLLLGDEPTGNLDSASGHQILDVLEQMNTDGLTLVIVTHDLNVGRRANRVLVLRDGEVIHRVAGRDLAPELLFAAPEEATA
jgi:putative ABC transport system ATP-binding protein